MNIARLVLITVGILSGTYAEGIRAQVSELTVTEIHRFSTRCHPSPNPQVSRMFGNG